MEQRRDESVHDYFSRMDKLVNKMKFNGYDIKEKDVVEKIKQTLSTQFDFVVAKDLTIMTPNDLQASFGVT